MGAGLVDSRMGVTAFEDLTRLETQRLGQINKRLGEIKAMQERLLDTYLAGTLDEPRFSAKSVELRNEENVLNEQLQKIGEFDPAVGRAALAVFDFVQNAAARWESSNKAVRREILGTVLLKRTLFDVNLCVEKRKPFDLMAEGLILDESRGDNRVGEPCSEKIQACAAALMDARGPHVEILTQLARGR